MPEAQAAIQKNHLQAVSKCENQPVTVYVHPNNELGRTPISESHFTVKPDGNMSGGVRFSGEQGDWDARLEIAVDGLIESLQHWLQEDEADRL